MSSAELELVQGLVDKGCASTSASKDDLYTIRGSLFNVQMELKEAAATNMARLKVLENITAKCRASVITQVYLKDDIEAMKKNDLKDVEQLDLVDIDTFLANNPDCTASQDNEKEFLMARLKDEEQRRARLCMRRLELEREVKSLNHRVEELRRVAAPTERRGAIEILREKLLHFQKKYRHRALFPDGFPEDSPDPAEVPQEVASDEDMAKE